uniref:Zona pellucida sperm-binding protein 4 n=1 Tax=Sciurus vulgaris TaxID=55149 RepID=A0A8D2D9T8_SCIVU
MWLPHPFWLCCLLPLAFSGQLEPQVPGGLGVLRCGLQSFQFTIDLPTREVAPVLTAWDEQGLPHRLGNNSDCGTWVREGPGGSVVLEASYSGCYVTEWGSQYVMPVRVEGTDTAGRKMVMKRRLLRCPVDRPAPHAPDADLCDSVPARDRLPCAPPPISRGDCEVLGCCYGSAEEEAGSCYYGNTVTSHCTQEGRFSIAVSRSAASPPLRLDSVYLAFGNNSECDPVMATRAFVLFQFPFTSCGTTRRTAGDQVVYENELVATRDVRTWGRGSITRDSIFRLRVSCSYAINGDTFPVNVQVFSLPPPLAKAQPGALALELQIAKDKNYGSYYAAGDYPVVKVLRDPIYVEVSVLHRTDPNLGLLLRQCWATPSPSPLRQPQWPILVEGCPYAGDNYQTRLIPVQKAPSLPLPSHRQRFSIATFGFVDPARAEEALGGQVYLHCSVSVCQPAGTSSCMVTCPVTRRKSELSLQNNTASISSSGPMILLQALKDPLEKSHKYLSAQVDAKALWVAGLSGTVIIGVLLVFYLNKCVE